MPIPIAVFGAFAYGLSTYLLIILQVGHNTKAQALAYMPLVIGGMYMILNDRRFGGFILTVFALSMQIRSQSLPNDLLYAFIDAGHWNCIWNSCIKNQNPLEFFYVNLCCLYWQEY